MRLRSAVSFKRGDMVKVSEFTSHRVAMCASPIRQRGFTLIELVISITVLTILTLACVPLVRVAIRRQKEQQLRETLRSIRTAIDQFHREAAFYNCNQQGVGQINPQQQQQQQQQQQVTDPRIKVMITDCTIFGVDNPDRYPPDLETLVTGVNVTPLSNTGGRGQQGVNATDVGNTLSTKKKVYLRELPIDPMTGKAEWDLRSCYDPSDSDSWGGENVFDVRSKSKATALNGEKYSDW